MNYCVASLKGKRPNNEDAHEIFINLNGEYNREFRAKKNNINVYGVFDGHGGKYVSNFVKNNLIKFFINGNLQFPLHRKYIYEVYNTIQQNLRLDKNAAHCGSTGLVVVHYKEGREHFLNVINNGDSRCVLCRDNFAIPLTKDHKPNWPEEHVRITQLGGKIEFDGYDWRIKDLSVSRSFGDLDCHPYVTHIPDVFKYKLSSNDLFIVLGCDGLYDVLSNDDIVNFVLTNCFCIKTKKRININYNISKRLAEYAISKGSTDNVSVVVVFFNHNILS